MSYLTDNELDALMTPMTETTTVWTSEPVEGSLEDLMELIK